MLFTKNSYSVPPEAIKLMVLLAHEVIVAGAVTAPPFAVNTGMGKLSTLTVMLLDGISHKYPLRVFTVNLL